jgi:integration host factor subunit beta
MTRSELVCRLAARRGIKHRDAEKAVAVILEVIAASLAAGGRVELRGFGAFSIRQTPSRLGRNPRTGAQVVIGAKRHVYFRAGKETRHQLEDSSAARLVEIAADRVHRANFEPSP